ncbi:MAG: hypothetical protein KDD94_04700 [Calditrichaeota bacterium]|nr:hypothetical protein [Calditrichota bacterium]
MRSILIVFLFATSLVSQDLNIFQPRRFGGSTYQQALGYGGLASYRNGIINIKNPASWVEQRLTIFEFNLASYSRSLSSNSANTSYQSTNFEGLNWVSSVKDSTLSIGFTLSPFQDQHVSILNKLTDYPLDAEHTLDANQYINLGGSINQFSFGAAYRANDQWFLGLSVDYYSGSLSSEVKLEQVNSSFINYNVKVSTTAYGLNFGLSTLYRVNDQLSVAAFFSPKNTVKTSVKEVVTIRNQENIETKSVSDPFHLPQRLSLGLNWKFEDSGNIYLDYDNEDWDQSAKSLNKFSLSYQSTASSNVFDSFIERTNFMLGAYYYNDVFGTLNGEDINVFGFTAGAAIPFSFNRNHLFISAGYAKRGSISKNNFDESIFTINIGFSVGDFWYQPEIED